MLIPFFFNDTSTSEIYTLSLHDALPICPGEAIMRQGEWGGNTFYIAVDGSLDVFIDRKSTRLNSSHQIISYAVFCLKKKKTNEMVDHPMRRTQSASQQLSGARAVSRTAT